MKRVLTDTLEVRYSAVVSYSVKGGIKRRVIIPLVIYDKSKLVEGSDAKGWTYVKSIKGINGKNDVNGGVFGGSFDQKAFDSSYSQFIDETIYFSFDNSVERLVETGSDVAMLEPALQAFYTSEDIEEFAQSGDPGLLPQVQNWGQESSLLGFLIVFK